MGLHFAEKIGAVDQQILVALLDEIFQRVWRTRIIFGIEGQRVVISLEERK